MTFQVILAGMARAVPTEQVRTIADVKAHFAECVREAEAGRTIVVSRHGRPVAEIGPIDEVVRRGAPSLQPSEVAEKTVSYSDEQSVAKPTPTARRGALRALLEKEVWSRVPKQ